jgi:ribosomal-protein-alanine N-acetyltransferase
MRLRPAVESDIPHMMALAQLSPSAAHWTPDDYGRIFTSVTGAKRTALVADAPQSQEMIGFIVGNSIPDDDQWEIENIVVANAHQRAGIGSQLLRELIHLARKEGANRIFLEVRESNRAAISLYRKFGFAAAGLRRDYYSNPQENAVILRLSLSPAP